MRRFLLRHFKVPQQMCPWTVAQSHVTCSIQTRPNNGHVCNCEWDTSGKLCGSGQEQVETQTHTEMQLTIADL